MRVCHAGVLSTSPVPDARDPDPRLLDDRSLELARQLPLEQRFAKAMQLNVAARKMFFAALRRKHPHADAAEIRRLAIRQLDGAPCSRPNC